MKVAIIGSRDILKIDIKSYIPKDCTCIVSGGAKGVDQLAANYAIKNNLDLIEFLPDYKKYGKTAPLVRNTEIIKNSDYILCFWNGKSTGTKDSINKAKKLNKPIEIVILNTEKVIYPMGVNLQAGLRIS